MLFSPIFEKLKRPLHETVSFRPTCSSSSTSRLSISIVVNFFKKITLVFVNKLDHEYEVSDVLLITTSFDDEG